MPQSTPFNVLITINDGEHRIHINALPKNLEGIRVALQTEGEESIDAHWGKVGGGRDVVSVPEGDAEALITLLRRPASGGSISAGQVLTALGSAGRNHVKEYPDCPHRNDNWPIVQART